MKVCMMLHVVRSGHEVQPEHKCRDSSSQETHGPEEDFLGRLPHPSCSQLLVLKYLGIILMGMMVVMVVVML